MDQIANGFTVQNLRTEVWEGIAEVNRMVEKHMNKYRQITSNVMHRFLVTKPDKMSHAILGSIQTSASSEMAGRSERLNSLIPMFYGRLWKSLEIHI